MSALAKLEKQYPTSPKTIAAVKKRLNDSRQPVRRKAAVLLGAIHAPVDDADIKAISALLKANDPAEIRSGLKALRNLNASSAVPEILSCLKHTDEHVVRDACRVLAVIGNKESIPSIEPLLNSANKAIKKDAENAIAALRSKS